MVLILMFVCSRVERSLTTLFPILIKYMFLLMGFELAMPACTVQQSNIPSYYIRVFQFLHYKFSMYKAWILEKAGETMHHLVF